ncbi:aldehyde oxidoreductase molybdenum-binding subunit PaoC [Aureimonas leprariae]|uniref:Xanthine dehydrogenase family protein molybdopterin-binding subunit n=1 Tax=Plantimonas leprariae TaxID=2615207 RepID=A0A7V7PKH2_9HYPH|nr:aldehyde oxidoreductase molybdenum-binding subunit PaoC [Aureimonas leprariae]KAB0676397.1 xanthine dehydrogenase family protein molybdopterin-binding subunit [Aureimonas leprariae]
MKFDTPATTNPIDAMKAVGQPADRVEGRFKVSGTAPYAYERHDLGPDTAYGYVVAAGIGKGRVAAMRLDEARRAPGVLGIVTAENAGPLGKGKRNFAKLLGGPDVDHYHQALALVVARTFEEARTGAGLVRVEYERTDGRFDLAALANTAPAVEGSSGEGSEAPPVGGVGDFEGAFARAPVQLDQRYTTPDQSHSAMEPQASIARWDGEKLTLWTSNQMVHWGVVDLAATLKIPEENIHLASPYVGGGFGGKLFLRADALLAALGARLVKRPVKVALTRPTIANNTTHRPATIQRIRIGAERDGRIVAIGHDSTSGNVAKGRPETAVAQTQMLYAGANRMTAMRLAEMDLPEGNAMRAPGEAPGLMALEIAMDEMAEKLGMDPIEFRILNDTQVDPGKPERRFSRRHLVDCLRDGSERFGWANRNATPGATRDGRWLVGMGVAAGFRDSPVQTSGARVRLGRDGVATVETDMTDIGTGSYTIIAQTAAEMLGLPIERVAVSLGDSAFPVSAGSGGQWGANSSTAGVYAACAKLREEIGRRLGFDATDDLVFANGEVRSGNRSVPLADAAKDGDLAAEDKIEFGDLDKKYQQSTFAAHFVELGVDAYTGETRLRRTLSVCDAGRILNPKTARSQVIGAIVMGIGGALTEELAVDKRHGFFVNHDLASYEVPVHADIPRQDVVFLDTPDSTSSPMKAKGVGELGLCGVGAAVANAVYNATGIRVRDYPITPEKLIGELPQVA